MSEREDRYTGGEVVMPDGKQISYANAALKLGLPVNSIRALGKEGKHKWLDCLELKQTIEQADDWIKKQLDRIKSDDVYMLGKFSKGQKTTGKS